MKYKLFINLYGCKFFKIVLPDKYQNSYFFHFWENFFKFLTSLSRKKLISCLIKINPVILTNCFILGILKVWIISAPKIYVNAKENDELNRILISETKYS